MHWGALLVDQLDFYWATSLWPRVQGLTDDEYLWEPVAGCWSVRPGADATWQADGLDVPPPDPPPVTTGSPAPPAPAPALPGVTP